jgi:enoyl-CoA hydratase
MAYRTIILTVEDNIATITLNRPEALNALNAALWGELVDAMDTCDRNDKVRAIILTGSERAFAAGADVTEMAGKNWAEMFGGNYHVRETAAFAATRKPVIAAVAGYALGGGCELMMMCDTAIAADTAKFGQPEVNLGIIAGLGGTQRMARAIGKAKTMDLHLTGRLMDAAEAERSGLVARVVPAKSLMEEARIMAGKIARKGQLAVMASKDAINQAFEGPLAQGLIYERRLFQALFSSDDQKEGMAAFVEKREPEFRDR